MPFDPFEAVNVLEQTGETIEQFLDNPLGKLFNSVEQVRTSVAYEQVMNMRVDAQGRPEPEGETLDEAAIAGALKEPVYFTGAQSQFFIGGDYLSSCAGMSWQETHDHQAYYGYRSKEWDHVFNGKTMVIGEMMLNLLDTNLLAVVCREAFGSKRDRRLTPEVLLTPPDQQVVVTDGPDNTVVDRPGYQNAVTRPGEGEVYVPDTRPGARRGAWRKVPTGQIGKDNINNPDQGLSQLQQYLDDPSANIADTASILESIKKSSFSSPADGIGPEFIQPPPHQMPTRTLRWLQDRSRFGIDIRINYGDFEEANERWAKRNHSTGELVKNVIFTGQSRRVAATSDIVIQAYSFFAKRVDPVQ